MEMLQGQQNKKQKQKKEKETMPRILKVFEWKGDLNSSHISTLKLPCMFKM